MRHGLRQRADRALVKQHRSDRHRIMGLVIGADGRPAQVAQVDAMGNEDARTIEGVEMRQHAAGDDHDHVDVVRVPLQRRLDALRHARSRQQVGRTIDNARMRGDGAHASDQRGGDAGFDEDEVRLRRCLIQNRAGHTGPAVEQPSGQRVG